MQSGPWLIAFLDEEITTIIINITSDAEVFPLYSTISYFISLSVSSPLPRFPVITVQSMTHFLIGFDWTNRRIPPRELPIGGCTPRSSEPGLSFSIMFLVRWCPYHVAVLINICFMKPCFFADFVRVEELLRGTIPILVMSFDLHFRFYILSESWCLQTIVRIANLRISSPRMLFCWLWVKCRVTQWVFFFLK